MSKDNHIPDSALPTELEPLLEAMAENVHDEWAAQRRSEGWRFGIRRDDDLKQHPCLVAYDELTETEREYDRRTAMATLGFIQRMGYRIVKDE